MCNFPWTKGNTLAGRTHLPPEHPRRQDREESKCGSERHRHEDQEHRRAQDTVKRQSPHGTQGGDEAENRPKIEKKDWTVWRIESVHGSEAADVPTAEDAADGGRFIRVLSQSVCAWLSVHPTLMISVPPVQESLSAAEPKS